ncbi:MAG: Rho termination factor N-terminal domain-containing protein [Solirubrobacterales bacterium]
MDRAELSSRHLADLHALAAELGVPGYRKLGREELVEELLERDAAGGKGGDGAAGGADEAAGVAGEAPVRRRRRRPRGGETRGEEAGEEPGAGGEAGPEETVAVSGVIDILPQGHGFVRESGLDAGPDDVYVSASQIRRCELRPGDLVSGPARRPRRGERHRALIRVDEVNGAAPSEDRAASFEEMTPVPPHRRIALSPGEDDVLVRAADLLAPRAHGQRVLVHSGPRSGRTTLLRQLAGAIAAAPDGPSVVVLLIDERPEEVTEWRRQLPGAEIAAAAADLEAAEQVRHAELALARAKRRAESGEDIVLLVDSLTRLGVAYGDPAAVKPVFGAGRELEEEGSGSLTVIATVLSRTEDGDGALEAVKTTESATLVLDPELAAAGIVPSLDVARCGVSGEEALREPGELEAARRLRAELSALPAAEAAERLRERIASSASDAELLDSL